MAEDAAAKKLPEASTPDNVPVDKPCVNCGKKKYTLCIRARKPHPLNPRDYGHANLALIETGPDGAGKTTTYGNWPESYSPGAQSTLKTDFKYDTDHKAYQYSRCKEITEEKANALKETAAKNGQEWQFSGNNCATWSSSEWQKATGEYLDAGKSNWIYDSPTTLGGSISKANGGSLSNFSGNYP
jgi:hypothetical protein